VCVGPFKSGDTPLQHYNTALSLATAQECANGIIFFDNDDLLNRAKVRRKHTNAFGSAATSSASSVSAARAQIRAERTGKIDESRISTGEMNDMVAQSLAGILLPTYSKGRAPTRARGPSHVTHAGRPDWVGPDMSSKAESGRWSSPDEEEGRGGWIEASIKGINAASEDEEDGSRLPSGLLPNYFNASAFLDDLMPSPVLKYIDVRTVCNAFPDELTVRESAAANGQLVVGPGTFSYTCPSLSWMELADNFSDSVPRYDGETRTIQTFAARTYIRGASQTDCDSVDASIPSAMDSTRVSSASGGRRLPLGSTKAAVQTWAGLPTTEDWIVVGSKLRRMYALAPGVAESRCSSILSPGPVSTSPLCPFKPSPALRTMTVASNSDGMLSSLMHCMERVDELMRVGAYLHWYDRFGVTKDHIQAAAESVLATIDSYMDARTAAAATVSKPAYGAHRR
jgi:hypothetical protein